MRVRGVTIERQSWPLENVFRISRGSKTTADVLMVSIIEGSLIGCAEVVPYNRYNETIESVIAQIESVKHHIEKGVSTEFVNLLLPAGAARNALDCALWDLEAKKHNSSVTTLTETKPFSGCVTAQTLSIDTPEKMALAAEKLKDYPLIKIKFDQHQVLERMTAINRAAPNSQFIVDANEAWDLSLLNSISGELKNLNVALIEQPLSSEIDQQLVDYNGPVPICADESIHTSEELEKVEKLYQYINIKLDKTGGLTEALKLLRKAQAKRLGIMVGCMVGTSLAMAPATILASYADFVDLDGPALLAKDRQFGFTYDNGHMSELNPNLWGGPAQPKKPDKQFRLFFKA
ncbi:N-acetyl-D-Glu racemase DgcA [Aliikangiella coralliicola]|uniref:N-acetyl-D-Glu racemase DgcA n=1 Tax=Aliikangiella coralliicola TaxID=2592383 RepID=UPI001AF00EC0|nr:N-acetyl-D-Glu racemase DgcA [Aliikangiella coralliicola]